MEIVSILRNLWRRRLALVAGAALAIAVGVASAHPAPDTAVASADAMLDTPVSSLSHASPPGADALLARSSWLANLTATEASQRAIAHAAGLRPSDVSVTVAAPDLPKLATPLARSATDSEALRPEPYRVILSPSVVQPLIGIDALGPRRPEVVRLADAALDALRTVAEPESARAVVETVTRPQPRVIPGTSGRARAVALAVALFLCWSGLVVLWGALRSSSPAAFTATATKPAR